MRAIGIRHEVERLSQLNQPIHQQFRTRVVNIVVSGAVHDEEMALQALGAIEARGCLMTFKDL